MKRLIIAVFKHETNTFSPLPTPLEAFDRYNPRPGGPVYGADAVATYRGTNTPVAAYIDLIEGEGADPIFAIAASATPGGPVADAAFEHCTGDIDGTSKRQARCVRMTRKLAEWASEYGQIAKIRPSDGCEGISVSLAVGKWYDFQEFGSYLGGVGSKKVCRVRPLRPGAVAPKTAIQGEENR